MLDNQTCYHMIMLRRTSFAFLTICLLGQGCIASPIATNLPTISPTGEPSPEGFVTFREGFGKLPGRSPYDATKKAQPKLILNAELPAIPTDVTVLREWNGAPSETLLRNVLLGVQVPAGVLGNKPVGDALAVRWHDEQGYAWSYTANTQTVTFHRMQPAQQHPTDAQRLSPDEIAEQARVFLVAHGVDAREWGRAPEIRTASSSAFAVLYFADSRDGQGVVNRLGQTESVAAIQLDVVSGDVSDGWFKLSQGTDRSNYNALSPDQVMERLRTGGLNTAGEFNDATIVINEFARILYKHDGIVNAQPRTFYLPTLWAHGTLTRGDKTTDFATVIPLVRDDAFEAR